MTLCVKIFSYKTADDIRYSRRNPNMLPRNAAYMGHGCMLDAYLLVFKIHLEKLNIYLLMELTNKFSGR